VAGVDLAGQALTKDRGPAAVEIHGGETGREPGDATLSQGKYYGSGISPHKLPAI